MRKKVLALFVIAALLAAQLPILSAGAATADAMIYKQDFTEDVTVYNTGNSGLGSPLTDEGSFKQIEENGNRFGRFSETNTGWGRYAVRFDENGISAGRLNVHFRFRPFDNTFKNFGAVLIGNCDAKYNWLSLINVNKDGTLIAGYLNNTKKTEYRLKDADGSDAKVTENTWYTYDAILNLDTRSMDIRVTEDGTNAVYTLKLDNMAARENVKGTDEWLNWPHETKFKDIGCLLAMDLDDVEISRVPLTATELSFLNAIGTSSNRADLNTKQIAVHFSLPVSELQPGAVMLDGTDYSSGGALSEAGMTYTFTLNESLEDGREYSVTVNPALITAADADVRTGECVIFKFIPEGFWKWNENFSEDVTVCDLPTKGGIGKPITDTSMFEQMAEGNNRFGRFYANGGTWGRCGLEFDRDGISEGQLKLHFRFRPFERTFADKSFGTVLIGNCDAKYNWLALINVQSDGIITAGCANSTLYALTDSAGKTAKVNRDTWYTYDAIADLDAYSLDVKVTEDGTNDAYTLKLVDLPERGGTNEWLYWPDETLFKDIGVMFPMDLDDIEISYMPLSAASLSFIDKNGKKTDYATDMTTTLRLNFSSAVQDISGKISLDGQVRDAQLSADGKYCDISLTSALTVNSKHTLRIDEGIIAFNSRIPASVAQTYTFTVSDVNQIFAEDYEGESMAAFVPLYGAGVCDVAEQNGNRYGKISTNWGRAGYRFAAATQGKVRVRFDFMFDSVSRTGDDEYTYVRFGHENGNANGYINDPLTLLCRQGSELRFAHYKQDNTEYRLGTVRAGVWYSYDATLDLDTRTMHLKVSTDEGTKDITKVIPLKKSSTTSNDRYVGWPNENIFDQLSFVCAVNVDNIRIEKAFDLPDVTADSISLLKANGEAEADLTAVNPSVNQMRINFGEQMNAASVTAESIKLTAANGEAVRWSDGGFDSNGKVYTINFDGLKSNTAYTLTVSGKVENADGGAMGADKTVSFTTGVGTFSGGIDSVTVNGTEVAKLSALSGTAKVKVTVPNASDKDGVAVVYLAYYDANNKILGICEQHMTAPSVMTTVETFDFPVNKPTGTARAVFLLWSGDSVPMQSMRELR